jgi:carbon storage regulator
MLVLSRRANQSIIIGQDIVVTVIEVRGDQVRLGIDAPREVTVHREEVAAEIRAANRAALSPDVDPAKLPRPVGRPPGGAPSRHRRF